MGDIEVACPAAGGGYGEIWGDILRYGRCQSSWSSSWSEIRGDMGRYMEIWKIYKPLVQRLVGDMGRYGNIHGDMGDT
jgi:hypothetical protein